MGAIASCGTYALEGDQMDLFKRFVGILAAAVVCLSLLGAAPAHAEGVDVESARAEFVSRINDLRASQGLSQLVVSPELSGVAQDWAQQMANAGSISHRPNLADVAPTNWMRLGENVGVGPSVASLDAAFIASPHHYANLVDPAFQFIGIGVVVSGSSLYVTENFMTVANASQVFAASVSAPSASTGDVAAAPAPACSGRKCKKARSGGRRSARRH